jgi:hypothetical protein
MDQAGRHGRIRSVVTGGGNYPDAPSPPCALLPCFACCAPQEAEEAAEEERLHELALKRLDVAWLAQHEHEMQRKVAARTRPA